MKIKKELEVSPAKLSEPWRNIEKGEQVKIAKNPAEKITPKFRVAGYVRLSPTGDEREEGSLVSHPQRIQQFVDSKNIQCGGSWGEIVEWYVDKDLSGKDMNRPSFRKLLADIKSGYINAVVITELSRLNRKVRDFCEVWELFKEHGVAMFSLKENFDTSTPMGELMLIQAMSFAQFERQTIVDRIKKGSRARAERGLANGCLPLGFKLVDHKPNYREIDETEKAYVELIFKKFLEIKRILPLVHFLNENGYRTKEFVSQGGKKMGGKRWTISSMHTLLTNRSYIGEREINKKARSNNSENLREEDRYYFVQAHWPALIPKELFFDVQSLLEQNKKKARKYVHEYRLTGLIDCAECGQKMTGKSGTGKSAKYFYYGHKRKLLSEGSRHLQRCKYENIPALAVEEAIISKLKDLSTDRKLIAELARSMAANSTTDNEHHKALMAAKEQERRKLDQKLNNLYEAISEESDRVVRQGLSQKARETKELLEQLDSTIQSLKREFAQSNNVVDLTKMREYIEMFKNGAFDALPIAAQSEILRQRVRRIIMREDGVFQVEIYGEKPNSNLTGVEGAFEPHFSEETLKKSRSNLSGVLPTFKLVPWAGIEPARPFNRSPGF